MKKFIIFTLITFANSIFAETVSKIEEIGQFEIRSYGPQKVGVKDLVFEARIDNLTELLSKNLALGKLIDVSFKIYWLSPSQYKIVVNGLPKGFQEIKDDLSTLIQGKLEFVLPEKFSDKFNAYSMKSESVANGTLIKAIDATYTLAIPEVDISFDKSGQLKSIETRAPSSAVKNEFSYSPKSWSANKMVLDKIVSTQQQFQTVLTTVNEVEYISVGGIGFPEKIKVKNTAVTTIPKTEKEKEKKVKQESSSVIRFSKYEINSGKAQKIINESAVVK